MTEPLPAPPASAAPESHADWLELKALRNKDKNSSLQDLVQEIRRSGSTDALDPAESIDEITDTGSQHSQLVAEEALNELSDRVDACGKPDSAYAFEVYRQYIQLRPRHQQSVYTFLLLLSRFGKDAGPDGVDAVALFEELSAFAAREYFGGSAGGAQSYLFGFPRRVDPRGFRDALDRLSRQMGEGGGCRDRPKRKDQKDAKLDVAVWRGFDDGRAGKLVGFGQCATGNDWPGKTSELQPDGFIKKWLHEPLTVDPVRLFFVPFRVEQQVWAETCIDGGILLDRCRISALTARIGKDLRRQCATWTQHVRKARL